MLFDRDAGHHQFMEDVYECQSRNIPGGSWGEASRPWTDVVTNCSASVSGGSANVIFTGNHTEKLNKLGNCHKT